MYKRQSIARLAYYDSLTGAYNKNKFVQEAGELLRQKNRRYMLAALDIRNFSFINEVYGFDKGDQLLRHMKQVLEKQVKENEVFFRSEADRFCALLIYESDERAVERITQILAAIDDYSLDRGQKNSVVCLCGIKVIAPVEHGEGLELRLDRAFMALDKAKETGVNCVFFDDELYAPVSYTHLDVYKRQDPGWFAGIMYLVFYHTATPFFGIFSLLNHCGPQPLPNVLFFILTYILFLLTHLLGKKYERKKSVKA